MCEKCINALNKYFPDMPWKDAADLLWSATSFPFGRFEQIEQQLAEEFENRLHVNRAVLEGEPKV